MQMSSSPEFMTSHYHALAVELDGFRKDNTIQLLSSSSLFVFSSSNCHISLICFFPLSFLVGFICPLMWYYATVLYFGNYYKKDPRERAGLAASAIAVSILLLSWNSVIPSVW